MVDSPDQTDMNHNLLAELSVAVLEEDSEPLVTEPEKLYESDEASKDVVLIEQDAESVIAENAQVPDNDGSEK